eukprot:8203554-Pyramimonas_sp.AAC.1
MPLGEERDAGTTPLLSVLRRQYTEEHDEYAAALESRLQNMADYHQFMQERKRREFDTMMKEDYDAYIEVPTRTNRVVV